MKLRLLVIITVGILAFFTVIGIVHEVWGNDLKAERTLLVMRRIGHEILLNAGDSTSRVLPIKRPGKKSYQLQFEHPFAFNPDTLVAIIHSNISSSHLPSRYMVSVTECHKHEMVYGYEMVDSPENSVIPCLERKQPPACYAINITFTGAPVSVLGHVFDIKFLYLTAFVFLSFVGYVYIHKRNKKNMAGEAGSIVIGKYVFCFSKQSLTNGRKSVTLSAKESKLLQVFAENQNQLLDRGRLLKEVWEDDGIFVGRSLDVFVSKLRKKLIYDPSIKITNVHGKGYKLEVDSTFF